MPTDIVAQLTVQLAREEINAEWLQPLDYLLEHSWMELPLG